MVLKTTGKIPKKYLFNAAGSAFLLLTAGFAVRSAMVEATPPPCTERYASALLFSWQQPSGAPLSAPDLQSRLAGRDWGVLENVSFVRVDGAPAPVAMQVKLDKAPRRSDEVSKHGMGFTWLPRQLATADVACLSYSVWVPENFAFGSGGSLPGLFGGEPEPDGAKPRATTAFSTRMRWREDAAVEVRTITPDPAGASSVAMDKGRLRLPRNRWFRLEQEVVLNTPGEENGALRVWVDGKFTSEVRNVALRKDPAARFLGVIADVHYAENELKGGPAAQEAAVIRLSPFELRWR